MRGIPAVVSAACALLCACGGGTYDPPQAGYGRLWIVNSPSRADSYFACDGPLPNALLLEQVFTRTATLNDSFTYEYGPLFPLSTLPIAPGETVLGGSVWADAHGTDYDFVLTWSDGTASASVCVDGTRDLFAFARVLPGEDVYVTLVPP